MNYKDYDGYEEYEIKELKDKSIEVYIYTDDYNTKILKIIIDESMYSMNIDWVPDQQFDWFINVYVRNMYYVHTRSKRNALNSIGKKVTDIMSDLGIHT